MATPEISIFKYEKDAVTFPASEIIIEHSAS